MGAWLEAPSLSCPTAGVCVPDLLICIERTGMTTVPSRPVAVIGGVDTHADIHVAAACDPLGAVLGTDSFPTTRAGYRRLLAFLASFGPLEAVGVEGTGSYGAGPARHLAEADVVVIEVHRPPAGPAPARQDRHRPRDRSSPRGDQRPGRHSAQVA